MGWAKWLDDWAEHAAEDEQDWLACYVEEYTVVSEVYDYWQQRKHSDDDIDTPVQDRDDEMLHKVIGFRTRLWT